MKRFLYALVALIATLSFSVGVRSAAWASGGETTNAALAVVC